MTIVIDGSRIEHSIESLHLHKMQIQFLFRFDTDQLDIDWFGAFRKQFIEAWKIDWQSREQQQLSKSTVFNFNETFLILNFVQKFRMFD